MRNPIEITAMAIGINFEELYGIGKLKRHLNYRLSVPLTGFIAET